MKQLNQKAIPTTVAPIDWKRSFSFYPHIIIPARNPIEYPILCMEMSDGGKTLTILPALGIGIDEMLNVLEGCLMRESNFRTALAEYYGDEANNLTTIKADFNGIQVVIDDQMTAWEAKLSWLRAELEAGYATICMTSDERAALERESAIKEKLSQYKLEGASLLEREVLDS